jgi:hypothetical protein
MKRWWFSTPEDLTICYELVYLNERCLSKTSAEESRSESRWLEFTA